MKHPSQNSTPPSSFSTWFAKDPSKAWCERHFLITTPLTIAALLVGIIGTGLYQHCGKNEYLWISIVMAIVPVVGPLMFPGQEDRKRPWYQRFWVKANIWNAIFGFVGNYFWTHYFYELLGAKYTFETYSFNRVPIPCYLATQPYFCFYHTVTTLVLRKANHYLNTSLRLSSSSSSGSSLHSITSNLLKYLALSIFVLLLAYITALMETVTIAWFPHYDFQDRAMMYKVGSAFYGIYFIVSFPVFWKLDEDVQMGENNKFDKLTKLQKDGLEERQQEQDQDKYGCGKNMRSSSSKSKGDGRSTLFETAVSSLAAAMMVTILLDFWRLGIGSLDGLADPSTSEKLPFVYLT